MGRGVLKVGLSVALLCSGVLADVMELKDGSRLMGRITGASAEAVTIKTAFAGELSIPLDQLVSLTSDQPLNVAFTNGNTLLGKLTLQDGRMSVAAVDGMMSSAVASLAAAWPEGAPNPLVKVPKLREWKHELSVDSIGRTGNSEQTSIGGGFRSVLASEQDQLDFYAKGRTSRDSGEKTVDELLGGVDYEYRFAGRSSWYARSEFATDAIQLLDLRSTTAVGYGLYFIQSDAQTLRCRIGALYLHESWDTRADTSTAGIDFGLKYSLSLKPWAALFTDITYTPSVEDFADYRLDHEGGIDLPLAKENWKLRLGIANEYTSLPPSGTERLDTSYFARVVFGF